MKQKDKNSLENIAKKTRRSFDFAVIFFAACLLVFILTDITLLLVGAFFSFFVALKALDIYFKMSLELWRMG